MLSLDLIKKYAEVCASCYREDFDKCHDEITLSDLAKIDFSCYKTAESNAAGDLVTNLIGFQTRLMKEELLSRLFYDIAAFIVVGVYGGEKSSLRNVDLEFIKKGIHYIVSVKPDLAWGTENQRTKLVLDLHSTTERLLVDSDEESRMEAVLGIAYGRQHKFYTKPGCLVAIGQQFWYLVYENYDLYADIIVPIYQRSQEEMFSVRNGALTNRLTLEFIDKFCDYRGAIDRDSIMEFNSGYFDLDQIR